ncbi:uncharacterized protein LOC111382312 [Olea europaea var. sylvestris]|uniref:uncharacterized protein LOC111382312 n=1 Tax=Olea europaea var. sylvestris TaxID=158386 RepID=UPI000C1D6986|nr:uncharacterized protein LOC111382312 [Olea europaea var. sylvestris]
MIVLKFVMILQLIMRIIGGFAFVGKAAVITIGGLVTGAIVDSAVESWLQVSWHSHTRYNCERICTHFSIFDLLVPDIGRGKTLLPLKPGIIVFSRFYSCLFRMCIPLTSTKIMFKNLN